MSSMQSLDRYVTGFAKPFNTEKEIPDFKAGDKIVVKSRIKEGDKERVQAFEGIVIARAGREQSATFTVRKVSSGIGVERIFPLYSPNIVSIERKVEGFVRRAKLYYIRGLDGKAARIRDKNIKLMEAQGGQAAGLAAHQAAAAAASEEVVETTTAEGAEAPEAAPKKTKK